MKAVASSPWDVVPLGTLADFRNGVNYTKKSFGRGIKIINVKNFKDYSIASYDDLDEIDPDGVVRSDDVLMDNDIIFVRSNGNRELIGRTLFVSAPRERVTHSAFTIRARFTSDQVLPRFYAYLFRSPLIRHTLSAKGGGTNISNLNQGILSSLEVPLPPFSVQQSIVEILSAYDDAIGNNTRRIEILEEMAHTIYREWFVRFRFPCNKNGKVVDSACGPIPEGWAAEPIGNTVEITGGGTPSTKNPDYWDDGDVIWYSPSDLTSARSMFVAKSTKRITASGLRNSSARLFPPYSVMLTSRATIGVVAINTAPATTNQGFITCIPNDRVSVYQLYFWLLHNREVIISLASGATFKEINRTTFKQIPILVADAPRSGEFVALIQPFFKQIESLLRKNDKLRKTRDILLPKLISAEVDASLLDGVKGAL